MSGTCDVHIDLMVRTMGPYRLESAGQLLNLPLSGSTLEGLAYLSIHANQPVRKEKIASILWPDRSEKSSRGLLSTALWRMRSCLRRVKSISINSEAHCVEFVAAPRLFVDVIELEIAVAEALTATKSASSFRLPKCNLDALSMVIRTGDDDFLAGLTADWVLVERERVFNLRIRGLILLMNDLSERGMFSDALGFGRHILHLDPFRECVHRQVMWLYVLAGQQGNAICQYNDCRRMLQQELGIDPMIETTMLRDHILETDSESIGSYTAQTQVLHDKELVARKNILFRMNEIADERQCLLLMLNSSSLV